MIVIHLHFRSQIFLWNEVNKIKKTVCIIFEVLRYTECVLSILYTLGLKGKKIHIQCLGYFYAKEIIYTVVSCVTDKE